MALPHKNKDPNYHPTMTNKLQQTRVWRCGHSHLFGQPIVKQDEMRAIPVHCIAPCSPVCWGKISCLIIA